MKRDFFADCSTATATANTSQTFTVGMDYSFTHFRRDDVAGDAVRASIRNCTSERSGVTFDAVTTTV